MKALTLALSALLVLPSLLARAGAPAPKLLILESFTNGIRIKWSFPLADIAAIECWDVHRKVNGVQDKDYTLSPLRPSQSHINGSAEVTLSWIDTNVVAGVAYTYSVLGYTLESETAESAALTAVAVAPQPAPPPEPQFAPSPINPSQP